MNTLTAVERAVESGIYSRAEVAHLKAMFKEFLTEAGEVNSKYLTVNVFCKRYGLNRYTVYEMIKEGTLPAYKYSDTWRIKVEDAEAWERKNFKPAALVAAQKSSGSHVA